MKQNPRTSPNVFPYLLLILAVGFTFGHALTYPLLHGWDDNVYVTFNSHLDLTWSNVKYWFTHSCVSCYLPLTMLSFMIDKALWGLNPVGFHLQNIVWHLVACAALYGILRQCRISIWIATVISLLFAIHPQRVESVVWISERKDVLCAAFYLVSLLLYVSAENGRRHYVWLALVAFAGALLAKSMAVSLPVAMFFWRWHRDRGLDVRRAFRDLWPFVLLAGASVPVAIMYQSIPADQTTHMRQLGVMIHNTFWYGLKTVVPLNLCPIYPKIDFTAPMRIALAMGSLGSIAAGVWLWQKQRSRFLYRILPLSGAYLASLAPVIGILPLGYTDMSDRYSYIPSTFLWIGIAALVQAIIRKMEQGTAEEASVSSVHRIAIVSGSIFLLGFAVHARMYSRAWHDIHSLNQLACLRKPANVFALKQLGDVELDRENFPEALRIGARLRNAHRSWMTEYRWRDTYGKGTCLCAFSLYRLGQFETAFTLLLELEPLLDDIILHEPTHNTALWAMLADLYLRQENTEKAMECYGKILQTVPPESFEGHFYRGVLDMLREDYSNAVQHFRVADKLQSGNPMIGRNIEECMKKLGPSGVPGEVDTDKTE